MDYITELDANDDLNNQKNMHDLTPEEPLRITNEAKLLGKFFSEVLQRFDSEDKHLFAWQKITCDYNSGRFVPELFSIRGPRSERTLRIWLKAYLDNDCDVFTLCSKRSELPQRKVTSLEQNYLLSILLTPSRVKIQSAIKRLKSIASLRQIESETSIPTLTRWCKEWANANPTAWAQARMGSKFVSEHVIKSIWRDASLLEVGDVWVADGHRLAFDIINPISGKPARLLLILVIDWTSRYPVGASISVSEDSQHILAAFRNAFLNWGGLPKHVYLDNGKAFRSKMFHAWENYDLSGELGGIFPRLGIGVTFAQPYNARAKIIERFFLTFQEQFERFVTTFRGANIADKPATSQRNETWMQKMFKGIAPSVEEVIQMMSFFRHIYGEYPHQGLGGRKPYEVFSIVPIPEDRKIESERLHFMMLAVMKRTVNAEGIMLHKLRYYHDALVNHVGQSVNIRFGYAESRYIMVFDSIHLPYRTAQNPTLLYSSRPRQPASITDLRKEQSRLVSRQ